MKIKFFRVLLISLVVLAGCKKQETSGVPMKLTGAVFGTTYNIIYYNSSENFQSEIVGLFDKMNASLSTYIPNSDISKINNGDQDVEVDAYFKEVFSKSQRIFKETNGYFDPTVGNLVNAWGFGPEKPINNLDSTKVKELMQFVGFNKVRLEGSSIVKEHAETYFDFNSIAKGFGIDVVARFLESKKIDSYLVEIGGEIRTKGLKPENKEWTVQLDDPNVDGTRSAFTYLQVKNQSMASSGNYRKYRVAKSGEKFVHTINPKTGFAKESNLLAATVIAKMDCADVDAYATALMAMGYERSKEFLESRPELSVILIYVDKEGKIKIFKKGEIKELSS